MPVTQWSQGLAAFILSGVPFLIGLNFLEDMDHSLFPHIFAVLTIYIIIGQFVCFAKELEPECSDKIKEGRIDVWWGFYCYYFFLFWPSYLDKIES